MGYRAPYPEEFKQRAVKLVLDMGMSMREVAEDLGCSTETVRNWVKQAQVDAGEREGLTSEERQRLRELERENRKLRQEREILKAAAAFFAQETNGTR